MTAGSMLIASRIMKGGSAGIMSKMRGASAGSSILGGLGHSVGGKAGEKVAQWGGRKIGQGLKALGDKFRGADTPHIPK